MVFSSSIFLFLFLPLTLLANFLINKKYQNFLLLAASLVFYAFGEPKFVLVLCVSVAANYAFALLIESFQVKGKPEISKYLMIFAIVCNLSLLFLYKYLDFVVFNFNVLAHTNYISLNLLLPIGISFFTFQSMSYILDVYFQTMPAEKNIVNVGLYIAMFPKLLMGPIVRYKSIAAQIRERTVTVDGFFTGTKRFVVGLCKKAVLSVPFGTIADFAFSQKKEDLSVIMAWLGIVSYCLQLYFDFSGYSDMAIGLGKMFGFDFDENFDYPYISKSISEYWRRWHITLGVWFRDYLYTPLFRGIMQITSPITHKKVTIKYCDLISLFILWICVGAWHGSGWKFLVYGLWWFMFIAFERLQEARKKKLAKLYKKKGQPVPKPGEWNSVFAHIYTLFAVVFGQVIFRAETLTNAWNYALSMFGAAQNKLMDGMAVMYLQDNALYLFLGILFCLPVAKYVHDYMEKTSVRKMVSEMVSPVLYTGLLIIGIAFAVSSTQNAFIYFKF